MKRYTRDVYIEKERIAWNVLKHYGLFIEDSRNDRRFKKKAFPMTDLQKREQKGDLKHSRLHDKQ